MGTFILKVSYANDPRPHFYSVLAPSAIEARARLGALLVLISGRDFEVAESSREEAEALGRNPPCDQDQAFFYFGPAETSHETKTAD